MMTAGFGLHSWTTGDDVTILTDIRVAGEAGYDFVELRDGKLEKHLTQGGSIVELADALARARLRVLSVNTLDDATLHTGAELAERVARCEHLCGWAEALGAPYVIVGPTYRAGRAVSADVILERTAESLSRYVAVAAAHGVRIAFEFIGYEDCSVNNLSAALAALDRVGDGRLGLVIDAFHFYVGGSRFEVLEELDPGRLFIVHMTDADHDDRARLGKPNRIFPGEGVLPLKELIAVLRRIGYRGPYSLELLRPQYWTMDPSFVARRGLESMRSFV
jgi:2-keto-myo-inositol isomerase